jgi:hypothetical protein
MATFLAQMSDWYLTATKWRAQMLDKVRWMDKQTARSTALKDKYEDLARGELGVLGGAVPDWRKGANACKIAADGTSLCNWQSKLTEQYEQVMGSTFYAFRDSLTHTIPGLQKQFAGLLGHEFANAAAFAKSKRGGNQEHTALAAESAEGAAAQGVNLDVAALELNELVDSLVASETNQTPLSSTRAAQLTAHVANVQARVDLEIARGHAQNLELEAMSAANAVRKMRVNRFVAAAATRY